MTRRRCLIPGCPDGGLWMEAPSDAAAVVIQQRHYMAEHYKPLPLTDPRRTQPQGAPMIQTTSQTPETGQQPPRQVRVTAKYQDLVAPAAAARGLVLVTPPRHDQGDCNYWAMAVPAPDTAEGDQ